MKLKSLGAALALCLLLSSGAHAILNVPVPSNAYITQNGLDWAWASPLPGPGNGLDLTFQSTLGWRLPTPHELALAPLATDFLFAGANVPFNGTDPVSGAQFQSTNAAYSSAASAGAVATPYFSTSFVHADWQDGLGQTFGPWAGMQGANSLADQLVVRIADGAAAPEPGALALVGLGLAAVGLVRRRAR